MAANRLRTVEVDGLLGRVLLGKYRVDAILGHGGVGVVAACTHLALNERVAIKMLRENALDSEDAIERFMREARAAAKLRSEYVARVTDVGKLDTDVPYMVMELLEGRDLAKTLELGGPLPATSVVNLALQAAEALAEAHSHGIVHRDVKPSNLFVTTQKDGSWAIKVLDFGISKSPMTAELRLTQTQSVLGTPAYMSPEQMRSARMADARTDIWALGTVMYEALEGRLPFPADSFSEMCLKVCSDPLPAMKNAPAKLAAIVEKCLEKDPDARYQTMAMLGRDLVRHAPDQHTATMLVERMERDQRRSQGMALHASYIDDVPVKRRKKWPFVVAPALAVAIGTTLGLWAGAPDAAEPPAVPAAAAAMPAAAPPPPPAKVDPPVKSEPVVVAPPPADIEMPGDPAPAKTKPAAPKPPKRAVKRAPPPPRTLAAPPCDPLKKIDGC